MGKKTTKIPAEDTKANIRKMFDTKDRIWKINEDKNDKIMPINEINKKWDMYDRIIDLFIKNIGTDQGLRQKYAVILIIILTIELIALICIFVLKGLDILNYSDATFNLFITGGIAEVFVLVRVIVKYLFKDNLTNALNIILENNNPIRRENTNYNKNRTKQNNNKEN